VSRKGEKIQQRSQLGGGGNPVGVKTKTREIMLGGVFGVQGEGKKSRPAAFAIITNKSGGNKGGRGVHLHHGERKKVKKKRRRGRTWMKKGPAHVYPKCSKNPWGEEGSKEKKRGMKSRRMEVKMKKGGETGTEPGHTPVGPKEKNR